MTYSAAPGASLVAIPDHLRFVEEATLPVAAIRRGEPFAPPGLGRV